MSDKISSSYKEIDLDSWNSLLNNSSYGSFFQSPRAYSFFESQKGITPFVISVDSNGALKGLVNGIIQYEEGKKKYFTRRAIIFSGPLLADDISQDDLKLLLDSLVKYLKNKAIYIEIRNFHNYNKFKTIFQDAGFYYKNHLNFKVDCSNRTEMEKRMSKSKKRQIKKGLKEGAEIVEARDVSEVYEFYNILKKLYKEKVKTPLFPKEFFLKFFNDKAGKYLLVKYKEKVIGGIMCPVFGDKTIYEWFVGGEDSRYRNLYPSILATWAAMDYANKNGIKTFDFMGAGSPDKDYGVREFKSKFGGELIEDGRFIYILSPFLYKIGELGVKLLKKFK